MYAYYYDSAPNNNTEQRKRKISARLATIQRLKGNVQFKEVKAEECNCLQCITIRLYVMNLLLDKIQMILTFL